MRILGRTFSAVLLSSSLSFQVSAETADLATLFGARANIESVGLSPLGDFVVYKTPAGPRDTNFVVAEIATGKENLIANSSFEQARISDCGWVKNDRLICVVVGETSLDGIKLGFTRTFAIGRDGTNLRMLGTRSNDRTLELNQFSGALIDTLPADAENVLMQVPFLEQTNTGSRLLSPEPGLGVKRYNIYNGKWTMEERPNKNASRYVTDTKGEVRFRTIRDVDGNNNYSGKRIHAYRGQDDRGWKQVALADDASMVGFDESGDSIYTLEPVNGRDALVKQRLDGSAQKETVFAHDKVDITDLVRFGAKQRPVGVYYYDEYQHLEYFDEGLKKLGTSIAKALPGKAITLLDTSWDENRILLFAQADDDPGTYYVFDRKNRELMLITPVRHQLAGRTLAKTKPVNYPAADGTSIPGYLTLPPGGEGKRLPLIVMPHGGPSSRDTWGFDWIAQFLAANGYAVLQPNYRGSGGYGEDWLGENGFQGWRQAIGDINDGARWAVASGLADADRIGIVGWSYGGYAALQANVLDPALYKAAVAIAPVTDFEQFVSEARFYMNARLVKDFVGAGPERAAGSPAQHAAAFRVPVLMFHGTMDLNVDVKQSRTMARELRKEGKTVDYVEYDGLEHSLIDSKARIDMLTRIGAFLKANVP